MPVDVIDAIRRGDLPTLESFLAENPPSVRERIDGQRTLLHVATDWHGHFPNVQQTIRLLVEHGANLNAQFQGTHTETPLHWAASSDDVAALDTLLNLGADIEAPGAVIGGGTPLADAVGFGQWKAARRLIERGARSTLWQSAALGLMDRLREPFTSSPTPSAEEITNAFWNACHGGQLQAAQFLLEHGADLNWIGHNRRTPLDSASRNGNEDVAKWLKSLGAVSSNQLT